jgi:proline iminopeptidase
MELRCPNADHRRARTALRTLIVLGLTYTALQQCTTRTRPVSINRSEYVPVNGQKLYLLIRSADGKLPILLWVHGGPGGAERPLFRYFNSELEQHFTVVYWDQRGAGRSFDPKADRHGLTIARHLADLNAIIDHLRSTLRPAKVLLVGHSWGAALSIFYASAHPHKVSAVFAVNPLVSIREQRQAEYKFVLAEAARRHDDEGVHATEKIGSPPYKEAAQVLALEKLSEKYGGVFHTRPARVWIMLRAFVGGLVWPWEVPRYIHANNESLQAMNEELLGLDLARSTPAIDVPVVFFLGRYDRHADARVAAAYFETLRAPVKRLVCFENSAHNIPFEEARLFNATLTREFQSIMTSGGNE